MSTVLLKTIKKRIDFVKVSKKGKKFFTQGFILQKYKRDLIQEKFNMAIEGNSKVEFYLNKWEKDNTEIFSIKNLENVQGDERDVIFISFTYGKHPDAKVVRQYFGPITWDNGWRRLNVLYTRARKRIVAFSSMKPSDVKLTEGKKGTAALHHYLHYAETGKLPKVGDVTKQNRGPDSDFEIAVADAVRKLKYDVEYQVGSAGYFVDIGVIDPFNKNNYILGIEADGEQYHSSRSARDRDIIRQEILESLGWRIHRVWGPDWLKDSEKETKKIKNVIKEEIEKRKVLHKEQTIRSKQEKVILEKAQKELQQDKIELETGTEKKYIFTQDDARNELVELKKKIMKETSVQESKCILREKVLNIITETGTSIFTWADFQKKVPIEEREDKIDPDQFKYKDQIINITSKVLE